MINGLGHLQRNPPNCVTLEINVFDNFKLADELFTKLIQIVETCLSVSNSLCWKLISSLELPTVFDEIFIVTSAYYFLF